MHGVVGGTSVGLNKGEVMTAISLDGKATAAAIKAELAERVKILKAHGRVQSRGSTKTRAEPS